MIGFGQQSVCATSEVWDAATGQCLLLVCPDTYVPYHGDCLSPAQQDEIGPTLCRADETWVTSPSRGCKCVPPTTRNPVTGECESKPMSAATLALAAVGVGVIAYVVYTEVIR